MIKAKRIVLYPLFLSLLCFWTVIFVQAQDDEATEEAAAEQADADMEVVNVIGSRNPERSLSDSPVPVDVIDGSALDMNLGGSDLLNQLANQIPSFNIEVYPIADAATIIRPPTLRGLSSDATLVLVNGKRRHRGAVIALLGGGKNEGAHGPDISAIPSLALERVEVLRNGASAQYGSDAIAGVMNMVLANSRDARSVVFKGSQTIEGDGTTFAMSGIYGMPVGDGGSLTLSGDYNFAEPTVRSVQRDDAQALIDAGNTDVRQPYALIWGAPEIHYDFRVFANLDMPMENGATFYGWGNVSLRDTEGGFFYRNPFTRSGVFTGDNGNTALIADLGDDSSDCPVVNVENFTTPDEAALAQVFSDPNCYSLLSKFPGGFTPQFGGETVDMGFAVGFKGMMFGDWNFDTSMVWGSNHVVYYIYNTINPQLIDRQDNIPTHYNPGEHKETDWTYDFSLAKSIPVASGYGDVYLATGLEVRSENFQTIAGEEDSWAVNPVFAAQGFGVGSNGFPGFPPSIEVDESRMSIALWLDAEQELTSNILGNLAIRLEDYEDFGHTLNIKVSTLIRYSDRLSIRFDSGTSYSAPTAAQSNFRAVTTNFLISDICPVPGLPCLTDEVTLPPTHPVSVALGGEQLQPVRGVNTSMGFIFEAWDTDVTVDFFRIDVIDRLARTAPIEIPASVIADLVDDLDEADKSLQAVRFYTNNFDTRTEGIELIATRRIEIWENPTDFTFSASFIKTDVQNRDPALINDQRVRELEKGSPKLRANLNIDQQLAPRWYMNGRIRYYHKIWEPHVFTDAFPINVDPEFIMDAELSYIYNDNTTLIFGLENLLHTFPVDNPWAGDTGAKYPLTSAFGFNGAVAYFRANIDF